MAYVNEFGVNWRALASASVGLSVGYTFNNYVTNIISPSLIADLGWSRANFALLGLTVVIGAICQPIAGRITDTVGVRRMATIGVVSAPMLYIVLSWMPGPFWLFALVYIFQIILVGGTTSVVVYTRLIAEKFDRARGIALGIAASAPALAGAVCAPALSAIVDAHGWRAGYLAASAFTAVVGLIALWLIPAGGARARNKAECPEPARPEPAPPKPVPPVPYRVIARSRAFQLIIAGVLLCNLTLTLQIAQMKILLLDIGVTSQAASFMLSFYGIGTIAGRLLCGAALDRYPPHIVSALAMSAPAIGLFILALGISSPLVIGGAVALLGLSMGAEGDVGAYLVMRYFPASAYGTIFGLLMGALSLSGAIGALMLSFMLKASGSFSTFLFAAGIAAVAGGMLFLALGRQRPVQAVTAQAAGG